MDRLQERNTFFRDHRIIKACYEAGPRYFHKALYISGGLCIFCSLCIHRGFDYFSFFPIPFSAIRGMRVVLFPKLNLRSLRSPPSLRTPHRPSHILNGYLLRHAHWLETVSESSQEGVKLRRRLAV